jgi:hypothetical protein
MGVSLLMMWDGVRAWVNYIGFTSKKVFVVTFEA